MTKKDIDEIISIICPNDEDFEKACISPAYLKRELEALALEQEPCEDCISRREAIKMFTYNYNGERIPDYDCDNWPVQIAIKTVKEMLRELPSVTPQPKMGRWIDDKCSICGKGIEDLIDSPEWYKNENPRFCPFCGAKMIEPQESENKE